MKLTIKDRLVVAKLYPKTSDLITQTLVRDIDKKVRITQEEMTEAHFKVEGNAYRWDNNIEPKTFKFTETELNFLREQIDRLDKEKAITQEDLNLFLKIKEYKTK